MIDSILLGKSFLHFNKFVHKFHYKLKFIANQQKYIERTINSILNQTYKNYEIVIVENNSTTEEIFQYYKQLEKNEKIKIVKYPEIGFNYSKIINYGVKNSDGEYILQLNNDTEVETEDWLEDMLGFASREDVGAVGAKTAG